VIPFLKDVDTDADGRIGSVGDEGREGRRALPLGMGSGNRAIIFHAQVENPTVGIGKANDRSHQITITEARLIAFELDGERFLLGNDTHDGKLPYNSPLKAFTTLACC